MATSRATFDWADPLLLDQQLTDDERQVRDAAHAYCQERLLPRLQDAFRHEHLDAAIFCEMGVLGLLGPTEAIGGAGLNYACYGLVAREVERVDSGCCSMHCERRQTCRFASGPRGGQGTRGSTSFFVRLVVASLPVFMACGCDPKEKPPSIL